MSASRIFEFLRVRCLLQTPEGAGDRIYPGSILDYYTNYRASQGRTVNITNEFFQNNFL